MPQKPTIPFGELSLSAENVMQPGAVTSSSVLLLLMHETSSTLGVTSVQLFVQLGGLKHQAKFDCEGNSQLG